MNSVAAEQYAQCRHVLQHIGNGSVEHLVDVDNNVDDNMSRYIYVYIHNYAFSCLTTGVTAQYLVKLTHVQA